MRGIDHWSGYVTVAPEEQDSLERPRRTDFDPSVAVTNLS